MLALAIAALLAAADPDGGTPDVDGGSGLLDGGVEVADSPLVSDFGGNNFPVFQGRNRPPAYTRLGVAVGFEGILPTYYLLIEPRIEVRFPDRRWTAAFGLPLRVELVSFDKDTPGGSTRYQGWIRTADWNNFHDYARLVKYLRFARPTDPLHADISQRYTTTIGRGAIQRRYAPGLEIEYQRLSAQLDGQLEFGGFQLFNNDVIDWNQLSGTAYLRPFWFLGVKSRLLESLELGVSAGSDWRAPGSLTIDSLGVRQLYQRRLVASVRPSTVIGVSVAVEAYKSERLELEPYADFSMLLGGNGGFTLGAQGRLEFGKQLAQTLRLVAEFRVLGNRYDAAYFDVFYDVERFIYDATPVDELGGSRFRTKQEAVLAGLGARTGYYVEATWGIREVFGLTLALSGVSNSADRKLSAHLEIPLFSALDLFAGYHRRRLVDFGALASVDENAYAYSGAKWTVRPWLAFRGQLYKGFRVDPTVQRYANQLGFFIEADFGYESGPAKPPPPPPPPPPAEVAKPPEPDQDGDGVLDSADRCPTVPGPASNQGCPVPVGDRDRDGILDDKDKCPSEPEDKDGFEDADGCPDPDNDKDGVLDGADKCPNEAGPPENGGCPVLDKDGDGIFDDKDKCPAEPEDKDGFEDEDGCPELDNDKDGLPDDKDKCPLEAGPKENEGCPDGDRDGDTVVDREDLCPDQFGVPEEKGCPKKYSLVIVTKEKIEIKKQIRFATGSAKIVGAESEKILDEVAQALHDTAALKHLRVEGHTDSDGTNVANLKLSQDRADSVMAALIRRKVDPARLKAVGFGEEKPIASNLKKEGKALNRRTEFNVIEE